MTAHFVLLEWGQDWGATNNEAYDGDEWMLDAGAGKSDESNLPPAGNLALLEQEEDMGGGEEAKRHELTR